jgi:hypothetical protein
MEENGKNRLNSRSNNINMKEKSEDGNWAGSDSSFLQNLIRIIHFPVFPYGRLWQGAKGETAMAVSILSIGVWEQRMGSSELHNN